ncbi:murinoglobulin-1 isoform X2 [Parasteatoda tepidariorum]|uniref:murinoglobulin-1 isoform X2 n=1 Tax=Parasteatoda tepidariorum TaxID=114398 RepID=UPI001C720BBC|nr:murinoglobulin-1 isoform X2 [Parasteatoda tepidariorum]
MNYTLLLCVICMILCVSFAQDSPSQDGYIFTSPRTLVIESDNELHLRRFGKLDAGVLKVQVTYSDYSSQNDTLAAEKEFEIPAGETDSFLKLQLSKFENYVYNGRLIIEGTFGEYKISGNDSVYFSTPKTEITVIQTDKPLYKPGQTVKFRVLLLQKDLKPFGNEKNNIEIHVEDPKATRLFQFKDINLGSGLVQNEFPLSDEPVKGTWKIYAKRNNQIIESTSFEVKEYVLPKFDVSIKFPSFVLVDAETIPIEICAKYTYGKPVTGTLNLNCSLEKYSYSREKLPVLQETFKLDGCYNYTLNVSRIQYGNSFRYKRIMVAANVVEDGTGVDRNETQYLQRQQSPLSISFSNAQRQFYKPGLPYNGEIKVNQPDDTPAANVPIELCATITKERVLAEWWATKKLKYCKNYTSDKDGIIQYTVLAQNMDVVSIFLEAKSVTFPSNGPHNTLNVPSAAIYLDPYYSPSESFIQLQPVQQPVSCDSKLKLKLLFTSKESDNFKFYYQITKQSDVVSTNILETDFSVENDVSSRYESDEKILKGEETQLLPILQSSSSNAESDCPASKETKYLPPVGEVDFEIDVDAALSPVFYVLVYYVRGDRETVADSQRIEVQKCFKNKVKFAFGDEVQQPGMKTSVQITASPNSLCGIKTIDKSISLLSNNDQLTKEGIFQRLDNMDSNHYYTNNPCHQKVPQPGLYSGRASSSILIPPGSGGTNSYDDSLSAFQSSGFLVISDLILFTRPCMKGEGYGSGGYGDGGMVNTVFQAEALSFDSAAGPAAMGLSAARRPAAAPFAAEAKIGLSATKSVSEVRTFFPETWLFEMEMTGPDGTYISKEKLPDTITQWIGSAVCISSEDGLGISNTTSIDAFQAFFIDYTLPASVIRGEEFVLVVSIFSYADGALPLTVKLDDPQGFELTSESINGDICLQPDTSESLRVKLKATTVGKINITVKAETAPSSGVCGSSTVSENIAKDAITKPLTVEAEGFPAERIYSSLFCPSDSENGTYENSISLSLPEDIVPDSSRAYVDFTGNVLGKAMDNLDRLVALPTGCGEQNMVKFTPNYLVLDFLKDVGMLSEEIERRAKKNLMKGYQRELTYRHGDGSFSAFGDRDREGSMFLTAFVLRSFSEAKRYISIDDFVLKHMQEWIVSKQQENGCFPDIGKIIDMGLQGGIEKDKASGSITAYVLSSLLISKFDNESTINSAFTCLENKPPTSPYGAFLYAYAEALAGKNEQAKTRIEEVKKSSEIKDGMEFFRVVNGSESVQIETDAYAVLTTLKIGGGASDVLPYVRYLTAHMNPNGGFKSTQDTCVGLEALSEFAKLVYKDPLNLEVGSTGGFEKSVEINDDNKLLVQRFKVSDVPSDLKIQAKGTGCGLIQTSLRYNTKTAPEKRKFFLDVNGDCVDTDCKKATIGVVVSYLPVGQKAGMSLMEIKLITGTVAVKESLEQLVENKGNDILRYDIENNKVVLYFNQLTNEGEVFSFQVEKIVEVENSQPGTAKVYDYYANENSASTSYGIKGLSSDTLLEEKEA